MAVQPSTTLFGALQALDAERPIVGRDAVRLHWLRSTGANDNASPLPVQPRLALVGAA